VKLCVKIARVQLGPDKDLWKLSLLWLQRAQASEKGAIAHFVKQLLHNNDTAMIHLLQSARRWPKACKRTRGNAHSKRGTCHVKR
jgi:hypothetical protein